MIEINVYMISVLISLSACSILFFLLWLFSRFENQKAESSLKRKVKYYEDEIDKLTGDIDRRNDENWKYRADKQIEVDLARYQESDRLMKNLSYQVRDLNRILNTENEEYVNN